MSSINTKTNLSRYLLNMLFIINIKFVGTLVNLNGSDYKLVVPVPCPKGGFVNILIVNLYLMVPSLQVNL